MKGLRSTKEWPLTTAIETLRGIDGELAEYRRELLEGIESKVIARTDALVLRYMLHAPVDFREHVAEKAGVKLPPPNTPQPPAGADVEAGESSPREEIVDDATGLSRLGPPGPVAKTPRVEIDRSERKVPRP